MTKYDEQKKNTMEWIKRSNPKAWYRNNMSPQKWDTHLKELAKKRREKEVELSDEDDDTVIV